MGLFDAFLEKKYGVQHKTPNTFYYSDENGELIEMPTIINNPSVESVALSIDTSILDRLNNLKKENIMIKKNIKKNKWKSAIRKKR